jgi:hypothetical protein
MSKIHAQVEEKTTRDRKADIQKHIDKTHVRSPNFQVEDYVLIAEHCKSDVFKLQVKWKGPRRVASVESDYEFREKSAHEEAQGRASNAPAILPGQGTQHHCGAGPGR